MQPGDRLGSYEIVRAIGAGGMGEVYLARDTRLNRLAAIKRLPADVASDAEQTRRFIQEARLASSLNHPGIATIYDAGDGGAGSFIAMEYVDGETLAQRLRRGALPVAAVLDLGIQVADALTVAHERGIAHRDIKPDNLMIRPDGLIKILDFGLAKLTTATPIGDDSSTIAGLTTAGTVVGTINYMSPEQARGEAVDRRTDIFSLGVVLFEALTRQRPFTGRTSLDVLAAILNHDAGVPSDHAAGVPAELDRIVRKALRKNADERYRSIGEMAGDLKALRRDLDSGRAPARPKRAHRPRGSIVAIAAIAVVALAAALFAYSRYGNAPARAIDSIAVLPFAHAGDDQTMVYLAQGLTEAVTSNLSRIDGLRVMSHSSVARYVGPQADPRQAGRDLDVNAVLIGTVRPRGDIVTINLELIDVSDGRQWWGQQYPRKVSDLVQLQSELSRDVAEHVRPRLTGADEERLRQVPTANAEAYQLYLRGRYFANQLTGESLQTAIGLYSQALQKDPDFVMAHVGLAEAYILQGTDYLPAREVLPKAKAHATRALEIQPESSDAHAALGIVKLIYDWDWKGAEQELSRARAIESPAIEAFSCALHFADPLGRNQDAIAALQSAVASQPQSVLANLELGCASYYGRQYDQAIRQFRGTLQVYPGHPAAWFYLGRALTQKGELDTAIRELSSARASASDWPPIVAELAYAHARAGHRDEALALLANLREQSRRRFVDPYLIAAVQMGLGDKDATIAALRDAIEERSGWLPWLKIEPKWDPIAGDPRFQELLRRVGLSLG